MSEIMSASLGRSHRTDAVGTPRTSGRKIDGLAAGFASSYAGVVAFMAVVSEGSFAKAGDRLGVGRSAVCRSVQKLEAQLNARLFSRTTRSTSLTTEGERFYANCHPGVEHIVNALEDMRELREGPPQGHLRVHAAPSFGRRVLAPLLKGFHLAYPDISVDLSLNDGAADFVSNRIDVAFKSGRLENSQIVAKQLMATQTFVCASAEYVRKHGIPETVGQLDQHRCINFRLASGRVCEWEFKVDGVTRRFAPRGGLTFNDSELILQAVMDGEGIAQMAGYQVCDTLRSGQLVSCLAKHAPDDQGHYVCYQSRQHLPTRIRVFIDHMTVQIRALNLACRDRVPGDLEMARP